MSDTRSTMFIV